jgi:mannitol-specific phosphotransferase system IIBC component
MFNKGILAAIGAALLAVLYAIKRLFDSKQEKDQRAEVANAANSVAEKANGNAKTASEIANMTAEDMAKELSNVQVQTDADRGAVASGGLRDGSDALNAAIDRANGRV